MGIPVCVVRLERRIAKTSPFVAVVADASLNFQSLSRLAESGQTDAGSVASGRRAGSQPSRNDSHQRPVCARGSVQRRSATPAARHHEQHSSCCPPPRSQVSQVRQWCHYAARHRSNRSMAFTRLLFCPDARRPTPCSLLLALPLSTEPHRPIKDFCKILPAGHVLMTTTRDFAGAARVT
jgi:hypothetical protein